MSQKENLEATWEDMDWGDPEPVSAPVIEPGRAAASAPVVEITPASAVERAVPSVPARDAEAERQRLQLEMERVKMESEMARMKVELVEQQRLLAERQAKPVEIPRTTPLKQDPSAVYPPPVGGPVVFTPQTLATLTLEVESGEAAIVTVKNPFTVGRNKNNDLVIRDLHVSGHHAKFAARKDGVFEIVDLNSSGGTKVNGERIERTELRNGDRIEFATVAATFRYVAGGQLDSDLEIQGTLVQPVAEIARKMAAVAQSPKHGMLTVLASADEQSRAVPAGGQITIGRLPGNDIIIAEEHVSGRHARLAGNGGGRFELFDLGSSCGTFVNGIEVQHMVLNSGDRIRFGVVDCVFNVIDPSAPADSQKPALKGAAASLPKADDSGLNPLPEPKPALRPGMQAPFVRSRRV